MTDNSTYVKLYRKVLKNELFNEKPFDRWHAFEWMILRAYRFPKDEIIKGQSVHIGTGQLILSYRYMAEEFGWSVGKVRRFVELLVNRKIISISDTPTRHSIGTLVTIENYTMYQGGEHTDRHTDEYTDEHTDGHTDRHNIKKVKKEKKEKESKTYIEPPELNDAILSFIEFRKKLKKPMTDRAVSLLIGKLNKLSISTAEQIMILEQSIVNGWTGIYPLKEDAPAVKEKPIKEGRLDWIDDI